MDLLGDALVAVLALAGHIAFWLGLANRLHGTGLSRWTVKTWTWVMRLILVAGPIAFAVWVEANGLGRAHDTAASDALFAPPWAGPIFGYAAFCAVIAIVYYPFWLRDRLRPRPPFIASRSQFIPMAERLGLRPVAGMRAALLSRLPGNQLLTLEVAEHTLEIPRLPPQLDGLSLVHLTDLHFSGRVTPPYFHEAMRIVNAWDPDLVLVTGDLCEKAHFIPWVEDILGPVRSRLGKFFVLGNHDVRTHDVPRLRSALGSAGFTDLSGRWHSLDLGDAQIVLGGDERPWLGNPLDPRQAPPRGAGLPELRLVLLHTPDRLAVARAADADLVLAGHTHGGQIRLPWIGAIVCPSRFGMRYDAGLFRCPPTTMFVGRGLSAYTPVRFNCPAELTRLVLRTPRPATASATGA